MRIMHLRVTRDTSHKHTCTCTQGGDIKLYKGLACPLDDYELLLFSLAGKDGKTYPLCPLCYNSPPFEGAHRVESGLGAGKGGMPCATCPHPTCQHAPARTGVVPCPSCTGGTLVLDPVSAPKWRLDCNRCAVLIYLPKDLHSARVSRSDTCDECSCRLLELDWRKGSSPLEGGETQYSGCVACDDFLRGLCEVKTGSTWVRRGGGGSSGRGRGRGRGRHGRGRGGPRGDPKMSFRDF